MCIRDSITTFLPDYELVSERAQKQVTRKMPGASTDSDWSSTDFDRSPSCADRYDTPDPESVYAQGSLDDDAGSSVECWVHPVKQAADRGILLDARHAERTEMIDDALQEAMAEYERVLSDIHAAVDCPGVVRQLLQYWVYKEIDAEMDRYQRLTDACMFALNDRCFKGLVQHTRVCSRRRFREMVLWVDAQLEDAEGREQLIAELEEEHALLGVECPSDGLRWTQRQIRRYFESDQEERPEDSDLAQPPPRSKQESKGPHKIIPYRKTNISRLMDVKYV
eukprot:TRINITY_DN16636_c0_g1_i4.p1 TRINITY_DN16636_c0_g1~~TRINITY_DN16636_c0_g1_i4.p1  ORF type:complete len:280 (-),score=59.55 TRINITY_DN16636_c0_g1_i4:179-1018(-)